MSNPLLESHLLPPFSQIEADQVVPAIKTLTDQIRAQVERLVEIPAEALNWQNFVAEAEPLGELLDQSWSVISHLNSVKSTPAFRDAHQEALVLLTAFGSEMGQNTRLYEGWNALSEKADTLGLCQEQRQMVENELRGFRLSGVHLPDDQKKVFSEISEKLAKLEAKFADNVLDATRAWSLLIENEDTLEGIPASVKVQLAAMAAQQGKQGWLVTLDAPVCMPVLMYANDRALRSQVHEAWQTRASEIGPNAGTYDNTAIMQDILRMRDELARLNGFDGYPEMSLFNKMADTPEAVVAFLLSLAEKSLPMARQELAELEAYAHSQGLDRLEPWDVSWCAEKIRLRDFDLDQEALRPWFPIDRVLAGLFEIVRRLFGIECVEVKRFDSYHTDVRLFEIRRDGACLAEFFLDLYAREGKRGGAWMGGARNRRYSEGTGLVTPVAFLCANFAPPADGQPALLRHDDVITLFHEFGHGLHHMLTRVNVPGVAGINGVAWDAVELPSQFLENWCWHSESLALISGHFETGEPLPTEMLNSLLAARHFQAGMAMVRQLEFALFDLEVHQRYPRGEGIYEVLDDVRQRVSVTPQASYARFPNSFSHIFAGGYAVGYYSYKWAEVLSADAFSLFEENGLFDPATGQRFLDTILSRGGSEQPDRLFEAFRGRAPDVEALLRHSGIVEVDAL
jgi:oligopeptidase A